MGNWRTVQIVGTCGAEDIDSLRAATDVDANYGNFHCLSTGSSICGLNDWPDEEMNVIGNLAERDYSIQAVAEQLEQLVKIAPSLALKVHCGGEYEDRTCVSTITVANQSVTVGAPEIPEIRELSKRELEVNIIKALLAATR